MLKHLILAIASLTILQPASAQAPPGCPTPRYTWAEQTNAANHVKQLEKTNPHSPEMAAALEQLGEVYAYCDSDQAKALAVLSRALELRKAFANKKNAASPADTLVKIADVYELHAQYKKALEQLAHAEEINKHNILHNTYVTQFNILYHQCNCYLSMEPHDLAKAQPAAKALVALTDKWYGTHSAHMYQALGIMRHVYVVTNRHPLSESLDAAMESILKTLGNPVVGQGTARHLDLESILKKEDAAL